MQLSANIAYICDCAKDNHNQPTTTKTVKWKGVSQHLCNTPTFYWVLSATTGSGATARKFCR